MAIDIKPASVAAEDSAAKDILGHVNHESIKLVMFGNTENAQWAADRMVRKKATPPLQGELYCNRNPFALEVGDAFVLDCPEQNISDTVFRVMNIREEDLDSEVLVFAITQDIDYITSEIVMPAIVKGGTVRDYSIDVLDDLLFIEAPYAVIGENIRLIPVIGRKKGSETGYDLHVSTDGGTSYQFLDTITSYSPHGVLVDAMSKHVDTLATDFFLEVDFDVDADALGIDTIARNEMFAGENFAIISNGTYHEIINFSVITPAATPAGRYIISSLWRGRWDTVKRDWLVGDDFYFLGTNLILLEDPNFLTGVTRQFKCVPFNDKFSGSISQATVATHTFEGRAFKPYMPVNLRANDMGQLATLSTDCDLTWSPRIRNYDAGIGDADTVIDAAPTHEGFFKVECYVGGIATIACTTDSIVIYSQSYSNAQLKTMAGAATLADLYIFYVYNHITTASVKYTSDPEIIQVRTVT